MKSHGWGRGDFPLPLFIFTLTVAPDSIFIFNSYFLILKNQIDSINIYLSGLIVRYDDRHLSPTEVVRLRGSSFPSSSFAWSVENWRDEFEEREGSGTISVEHLASCMSCPQAWPDRMRQAHVREANIVQYEYMGGVGVQYGYGWPSSMKLWLRAWAWAWLGITPRGWDSGKNDRNSAMRINPWATKRSGQ